MRSIFVTKQPTTGPIRNEAFFSYDSLRSFRSSYGSGGSTNVQGLDYRFDVSRSSLNGFTDDTNTKTLNVSGQLNYRVSDSFKIWGAIEYKQDKGTAYWGTPLVPIAFSGPHATTGIVSGNYVSNYNGTNLGPVTIDNRTFNTNYNVLDNHVKADELWLRGGFEWNITRDLTLKSQMYGYGAKREWFNNEVEAFNAVSNLGRPRAVLRRARSEADRQHHRPDMEFEYRRHGQPPGDDIRGQQPRFRPAGRGQLSARFWFRWSIPTGAPTAC